jgi:hypothetical protein
VRGSTLHWSGVIAAFAVAWTGPRVASAQEALRAAPDDEAPPNEESVAVRSRPAQWYGWQILLADTGVAGTVALAGATSSSAASGLLEGTAIVGYLVDGPLIHAAHHQGAKVGYSLALRLLLPVAGVGIGVAAASGDAQSNAPFSFQPLVDAVIGFGVGMIAAAVVDGVALGWGPPSRGDSARVIPLRPHLVPSIAFAVDAHRDPTPVFGVAGSL